MKKNYALCILLAVLILSLLCACGQAKQPVDPWNDAIYTEDTSFGTGEKTVSVAVCVEDHTVTFTLHTDKETLGEALLEHNLIAGEQGAYGLYVKVVNGITADYSANQRYWSLEKNGEYMQTGVDATAITDGEQYALIYTE